MKYYIKYAHTPHDIDCPIGRGSAYLQYSYDNSCYWDMTTQQQFFYTLPQCRLIILKYKQLLPPAIHTKIYDIQHL